MSYGRFFACGNKLLSPTMEPDLTGNSYDSGEN